MILINGKPGDSISVHDRGLHYGDGLFETLLILQGSPVLWDRHMARLLEGCRRLGLPPPDNELLLKESNEACHGLARGVLKIMITRGCGKRGYRPDKVAFGDVNRILMSGTYPEYPAVYWQEGIRLRVCATRLSVNPLLAGIKHLNRLEQVLARQEWDDPAVPEGLMLTGAGEVISGTMTNVFVVRQGRLYTPDVTQAGIAGIMRAELMETVRSLGIPVHVGLLRMEDVLQGDEVFVTNSLIGIWPVRGLEDVSYGEGQVTQRLTDCLLALRTMPEL
jgi:4-amino-4-deoxychorismate lyase